MTLEEYEASIAAKRAALKKAAPAASAKKADDSAFAGLTAFKRVDVEAEVSELTALEKEKKAREAREGAAKKERQTLVPAFRVGGGDAPRGESGGGGRGRGGRAGEKGGAEE